MSLDGKHYFAEERRSILQRVAVVLAHITPGDVQRVWSHAYIHSSMAGKAVFTPPNRQVLDYTCRI